MVGQLPKGRIVERFGSAERVDEAVHYGVPGDIPRKTLHFLFAPNNSLFVRGIETMLFRAITSFVVVFSLAFVLGGWFLMPHLPPVPSHPVSVFELEYWTSNWAGAVLGVLLGAVSAWLVVRQARKAETQPG